MLGCYIITANWVLNNIITTCLAWVFIKFQKIKNFKLGIFLFFCIFLYSVFSGFYSFPDFGRTPMIFFPANTLPIKFEFPLFINHPFAGFSHVLGIGDIVFPAIFINFFTKHNQGSSHYRLVLLFSYILSLFFWLLIEFLYNTFQLASLYIFSFLLIGTVAYSFYTQEFLQL